MPDGVRQWPGKRTDRHTNILDTIIDLFYSENDFSQSSSVNDTSSFIKSPPTTNLVIVERLGTHSVNIPSSPNALERMGRLLPRRSARG